MNPDIKVPQNKLLHNIEVQEYNSNGWQFIFTQGGILTSKDLDMLSDLLILQGVPDIVFGYNTGVLYNEKYKFAIFVNARDALYFCNFANRTKSYHDSNKIPQTAQTNHVSIIPEDVKFKYAEKWTSGNTNPEIKQMPRISDSFYSTPYKTSIVNVNQIKFWVERIQQIKELKGKSVLEGHTNQQLVKNDADYLKQVFGTASEEQDHPYSEITSDDIPINNLSENNPILWASVIPLFEDELADNGHSTTEFRFRVMKDCFFGLLRSYLRVDDVIIRIYDTRLYHDFSQNYVLREFTVRESTWGEIKAKGFQFSPQWSVDPQQSFLVQNFVELRQHTKEKIFFVKQ